MKSTFAMAIVAALGLSVLAAPAEAKHRDRHTFGLINNPHSSLCIGYLINDCDDPYMDRLTCGEARHRVAAAGFTKVVTRNCAGFSYRFTGTKKGARYLITVNARTGLLGTRKM